MPILELEEHRRIAATGHGAAGPGARREAEFPEQVAAPSEANPILAVEEETCPALGFHERRRLW